MALPKRKSEDWNERTAKGFGDCIDCGQCVQVCPMGIDIRDGGNGDCINCGLCVDACGSIMDMVGRPRGLISYDTLANSAARAEGLPTHWTAIRPRTVVYALIMLVFAAMMGGTLLLRPRLDIAVERDRAALYVELSDGAIRNGYTIKISNMTRDARDYTLNIGGIPGAVLHVAGQEEQAGPASIEVRPDAIATFRVTVKIPREALKAASTNNAFSLMERTAGEQAVYDSVFLAPEPTH
jgi:cytochrome c oxidase accessory protein FixG